MVLNHWRLMCIKVNRPTLFYDATANKKRADIWQNLSTNETPRPDGPAFSSANCPSVRGLRIWHDRASGIMLNPQYAHTIPHTHTEPQPEIITWTAILCIGLDFGTDSVRAVLARTDNGDIIATSVHEYARWSRGDYCDPAAMQFRQHPLDYLEGTEAVVRGVMAGIDPARVVGIGIDTTGSTPCAVNRDGTPLALTPEFADDPDAMFILWKDHTAIAEAERINDYAHSWGGPDYNALTRRHLLQRVFWSNSPCPPA